VLGLLLCACGPTPEEVIDSGPGEGSSGTGPSDGGSTVTDGPGTTGPVADGSAGSGTGAPQSTSSDGGTTDPVDPGTTAPGSSSGEPPGSTGPASTSGEPASSSSGDPPTCDELYGMAPGYELCSESDTECAFDVDSNDDTCTSVCQSYGGTCIDAISNPSGGGCTENGPADCGVMHNTVICICSK
jgi:hypothetical protein